MGTPQQKEEKRQWAEEELKKNGIDPGTLIANNLYSIKALPFSSKVQSAFFVLFVFITDYFFYVFEYIPLFMYIDSYSIAF